MTSTEFEPEDLTYTAIGKRFAVTIALSNGRMRASRVPGATALRDDGIVDQVAIERRAMGDMSVRLSSRELPCFVAHLAANGLNDVQIGQAFGMYDGEPGRGESWARITRRRYGIPAGRPIEPALQVDRIEENRRYNAKRRAKARQGTAA